MTGPSAKRRRERIGASLQIVAFKASIADVGRKSGYVRYRAWEAGEGTLTADEIRRVETVIGQMEAERDRVMQQGEAVGGCVGYSAQTIQRRGGHRNVRVG